MLTCKYPTSDVYCCFIYQLHAYNNIIFRNLCAHSTVAKEQPAAESPDFEATFSSLSPHSDIMIMIMTQKTTVIILLLILAQIKQVNAKIFLLILKAWNQVEWIPLKKLPQLTS